MSLPGFYKVQILQFIQLCLLVLTTHKQNRQHTRISSSIHPDIMEKCAVLCNEALGLQLLCSNSIPNRQSLTSIKTCTVINVLLTNNFIIFDSLYLICICTGICRMITISGQTGASEEILIIFYYLLNITQLGNELFNHGYARRQLFCFVQLK